MLGVNTTKFRHLENVLDTSFIKNASICHSISFKIKEGNRGSKDKYTYRTSKFDIYTYWEKVG